MKKIILLCIVLSPGIRALAQHQTDKWYFGVLAGADFTPAIPVALTNGALNNSEGCSSVSDSAGNLLFYSDGETVWNRTHVPMPNGTGLLGGSSCTQAALIVPKPGSGNLFYEFTLDDTGGSNGLNYSVIDMTLDGGMGDVTVQKNIFVRNNLTEKLTAVANANGTAYWIAVHEKGTDAFNVYSLTPAGLDTNAVVSHAGMVHSSAQIQNTYGQMKFSPCGDKLALSVGYLNTVEIFHFDNSTGVVSPFVSMPIPNHVYGAEFSSDGTILYASTYDPGQTLVQFDLTSGIPATIIASQIQISITPDIYGLQLARDEKIYVCKSFSQWLGVINNPNVAGTGCNYSDNGINLDPLFNGVTSGLSLPGFVQSWLRGETVCGPTGIASTQHAEMLNVFPNPANDEINITGLTENGIMNIYNSLGETVQTTYLNSGRQKLSISKLHQGVFFYSIVNPESQEITSGSFAVIR
jgi:WD40 repeat protein